jgi:hypothetical protein
MTSPHGLPGRRSAPETAGSAPGTSTAGWSLPRASPARGVLVSRRSVLVSGFRVASVSSIQRRRWLRWTQGGSEGGGGAHRARERRVVVADARAEAPSAARRLVRELLRARPSVSRPHTPSGCVRLGSLNGKRQSLPGEWCRKLQPPRRCTSTRGVSPSPPHPETCSASGRSRGRGRGERRPARPPSARATSHRGGLLSALQTHTKAPYKTDLLRKTRRGLNRPVQARTA